MIKSILNLSSGHFSLLACKICSDVELIYHGIIWGIVTVVIKGVKKYSNKA